LDRVGKVKIVNLDDLLKSIHGPDLPKCIEVSLEDWYAIRNELIEWAKKEYSVDSWIPFSDPAIGRKNFLVRMIPIVLQV
jgi:hypothetical protein